MELDVAAAIGVDLATKGDLASMLNEIKNLGYRENIFAADGFVTNAQGNGGKRIFDVPDGMQFYPSRYMVWADGFTPGAGGSTTTPVQSSQTNAANPITATLPAAPGALTYITGFEVTGGGATAGSIIQVTVAGINTSMAYYIAVPAGAGVGITPLTVEFSTPIPASALNTAITVSVPSFGAGNTNAAVTAHGYQVLALTGSTFQSTNCYGGIYHGIASPVSLADFFPPPSGGLSEASSPNVLPYYKEFNKHDSPEFQAPDNVYFGIFNGPPTTNITCIVYGWMEEIREGKRFPRRSRLRAARPRAHPTPPYAGIDADATLG